MKFISILILMIYTNMIFADWKPTKETNFQEYLNSAVDDRNNKKYEDSLEKHIWFHENVLKYNESYYGVRLSFALMEWNELAEIYAPALDSLKSYATKAEIIVKEKDSCCRNAFHDFVSINRELNNEQAIVSLFKWLDKNKKDAAKNNYNLAQPALILAKEYRLCVKYIAPLKNFKKMEADYEHNIELSKNPKFGKDVAEYAITSFTNSVTTLISLLIVNERNKEALEISKLALEVMNDPKFNKEIEQALLGVIPKPWP